MEFYKETNFKETPIGKIPEDWSVVKLTSITNILKGFAFSSEFFNEKKEGVPLIRIRDLGRNETESYYSGPYDDLYIVNKGDILVSMDGEFNAYIWNGPPGLLNQRVCKFWSKNPSKLDNLFLYYEIQNPLKIIESQVSQTTVKHLLDRDIERIKIPLPSLSEQKGIVEILSVVDLAIQKTDEIIAKTERLKRGLMQTLLTKGIGHKEFKETPIGKIPKDWEIIKLGSIVEFRNGKRPETILRKGIPIYGANGIMGYTDKFLIDEKFTVIIARVGMGTVGKVHLAKGKIWVSDNAIYTRCKLSEVYPPYLFYFLKFMHLGKLALRSAAGSYAIITQDSLKNLKLRLPPLIEQQRIAKILMNIDKKLELEIKEKTKLVKIKQNLMDLLLTGKVRVKVN